MKLSQYFIVNKLCTPCDLFTSFFQKCYHNVGNMYMQDLDLYSTAQRQHRKRVQLFAIYECVTSCKCALASCAIV